MSTDRELLELAASAAGIGPVIGFDGALVIGPNSRVRHWNPLDDDGDALRLAVALGLGVDVKRVSNRACAYRHPDVLAHEVGSDLLAATRRCIVRAAAEIGRTSHAVPL